MHNFQSPQESLLFDSKLNAISTMWHEVPDSRHIRLVFNKAFELLLKNKAENWIIQTENVEQITSDDLMWISRIVVPHAVAQGLKRVALIIDQDKPNYYVASLKTALIRKNLAVEEFESEYQSKAWLDDEILNQYDMMLS
ncbi:hypothetical protein R9C00_05650 [Flammeovirgaceae bacterium SG7u.111]|nr:hypothetical protein [Flammeovirgaceae bacterium SG7u.132]WPO36925.1 hypothetical protein R9C00_05650 [Flammeovirgaceae bacterium SG7u.111]